MRRDKTAARPAARPAVFSPVIFAIYETKRTCLSLTVLGIISFILRNGLLRTIGMVPLEPPAAFGLFATAFGGMIAAFGCDEKLPPLPRPKCRIIGRVIVSTSSLVLAAVCLILPLILARVDITAVVLWRNLTLTFGLTLITMAFGGRGLAWVPSVLLLGCTLLFGGGWETGWWRYIVFLVTPIPLVGPLIIGISTAILGITLFAWRGVGEPSIPMPPRS